MIELTITIALTTMIVGVVASMYSFTAIRLGDAYTQSLVLDQVNDVADRIEATVRNADSCNTADNGATLICTMPQSGVDINGDGHFDAYYPDGTDGNGEATFTPDRAYWLFNAGVNGDYDHSATTGYVWRADSTKKNGAPRLAENDVEFMYLPGPAQRLRNPLVSQASFSVDSLAHTVTFTVTAGARMGTESRDVSDSATSRVVTITRTVVWRN